ncbi:MAG: CPBP family intramembrane metalloprotease [Chloroflexi bacterium]|nr:MAG: CPBP family intramembrane metalloprotease [Chloroflexota bacterium]
MAKKTQTITRKSRLSPALKGGLALVLPVLAGQLVLGVIGGTTADMEGGTAVAPVLAAVGVVSWLLGMLWYGVSGLGLRGGRPLFAGIGFASLGWVAFLLFRFLTVEIENIGPPGSGRLFLYLLVFEAFAIQVWTFGVLFRALAEWRGPLTAAVSSGLVFGATGFLLFRESFLSDNSMALIYFFLWGVLYGVIRLRTGSILGMVIVQAMQSFTAWVALTPVAEPVMTQLQNLYLLAGVAYLVFIWRLWPKQEEDYRV